MFSELHTKLIIPGFTIIPTAASTDPHGLGSARRSVLTLMPGSTEKEAVQESSCPLIAGSGPVLPGLRSENIPTPEIAGIQMPFCLKTLDTPKVSPPFMGLG
jgi:hypothetical protein